METNTMGVVLVTALIENQRDVDAADEVVSLTHRFADSKCTTRASTPGRRTSRCPSA